MKDPIVYAIPFFFLLMIVELIWSRWTGRQTYRLNDTVSNLGCGISNRLVLLLFGVVMFMVYDWFYRHYAFFKWDEGGVWTWMVAFVLIDVSYYWWHRASHRVNFLWAVHVVHHQSEDYNLAVALRQAWLSPFTHFPFFLPLAFLGLPSYPVFVCVAVNLVYQYWIHTELISRLGIVEKILNTPSHHRVHHGINRRYLDKNYAGVFITWDHWFKTFEPESEKPVYGVVEPLRNLSPIAANVEHWRKMFRMVKITSGFWNGFLVFFRGPEWTPDGVRLPAAGVPHQEKYNPMQASEQMILVQLGAAVLFAYLFLWKADSLDDNTRILESLYIIFLTTAIAIGVEGRKRNLQLQIVAWTVLPVMIWMIA